MAVNGPLEDRTFEAIRKNRREQWRLDLDLKFLDRAKSITKCFVERDKKQALIELQKMKRTSGICTLGMAPNGDDDMAYETSIYAAQRVSEKRLTEWRESELLLQKFLKAKATENSSFRYLSQNSTHLSSMESEKEFARLRAQRRACNLLYRGLCSHPSQRKHNSHERLREPSQTSLKNIRPHSATEISVSPVQAPKRPSTAPSCKMSRHRKSSQFVKQRQSMPVLQSGKMEVKLNSFFLHDWHTSGDSHPISSITEDVFAEALGIDVSKDDKHSPKSHAEMPIKQSNLLGYQSYKPRNPRDDSQSKTQIRIDNLGRVNEFCKSKENILEKNREQITTGDANLQESTSFEHKDSESSVETTRLIGLTTGLMHEILHSKKAFTKGAIKQALERLVDENCPDQGEVSRQARLKLLEDEAKQLYIAAHRFTME